MLDITKKVEEYRQTHCDLNAIPKGYVQRKISGVYVFEKPEEADIYLFEKMKTILGTAENGEGLILSTGSTFENLYAIIARKRRSLAQILGKLMFINQDELIGVSPDDPRSYHNYMRRRLFSKVPELDEKNWIIPHPELGSERALAIFIRQLETVQKVRLALLGIGPDGDSENGLPPSPHIGFIEPGTPLDVMAKIVQLDRRTRHANSGGTPGKYPSEAISHGPASVLKAETIAMLAKGSNKKDNMGLVVLGDYNSEIPASVVQIAQRIEGVQRDVRFFMDSDAAESIFETLSA